jgi:exosortase family protein XrtG
MTAIIAFSILAWAYVLSVFSRSKLPFFKFMWGSVGLFLFMMITIQPLVTVPLSKAVAASTGIIGDLTGMFYSYYQYSLIFIEHGNESISLYIDYECSGIIELMSFSALLWFFPLYDPVEKLVINISGLLWIFASNILRLTVICMLVYFLGNDIFFFAHAIFGRVIFYGLSIMLYFYVFTRSQILKQKVGKFRYGNLAAENI